MGGNYTISGDGFCTRPVLFVLLSEKRCKKKKFQLNRIRFFKNID